MHQWCQTTVVLTRSSMAVEGTEVLWCLTWFKWLKSGPSHVTWSIVIITSLMKVQNEHSTLGCDEHFDEKSNILERYYNCDAPIYSGADRDVQLKAGVKENVENFWLPDWNRCAKCVKMTLNTLCGSEIDWIYRTIVGQIDRFAFRWSSFERESVLSLVP